MAYVCIGRVRVVRLGLRLVVGTLAVLAIAGISPAVAVAKGAKDAGKDGRKASVADQTNDGEGPSVAEEARIACLAGDWQKGVRLLAEVYVATKEPTWLYNQGRCYQQSNQGAMAITRFRDYLRVAPPENPLVAKAKTYIAEIEADLKKNEPAAAPAPAPAPTIVVQPAPVQVTTTPAVVVTSPSSEAPPQRSVAARAATVSLLGVGALGLGLGVFSSLKVSALQSDAESGKVGAGQLEANRSDASRYETLQWVGYGVGAAALVGAGVVYGLSGRRGSSDGAASARADGGRLSAMWTRGSAGLLWEGTF